MHPEHPPRDDGPPSRCPPPNRWGPIRIAHQTKPRHRSRKLPAICRSGGLDGFGRDCERLGVRRPAGLRHAVTKCAVWPERCEPVGCWAVPKLTSTTPSQGCGSGSVRPSTVRSGPRPAYCRKNGLVVLLPRRPPARRSLSHSGKFDFGLLGQRGVPPRTGRLDRREADRFSYPPCREGDRCAENVILAPAWCSRPMPGVSRKGRDRPLGARQCSRGHDCCPRSGRADEERRASSLPRTRPFSYGATVRCPVSGTDRAAPSRVGAEGAGGCGRLRPL